MRSGFGIGRLFGIKISVDWSWIFIFLLVTWNLSTGFRQAHPDWGSELSWGVALLAALLFFASVLAHELAHSLVAKAQGLPVRNITLFLFGGVSNIEREPPSPRAEFLIAIVGPLTSFVLGVLFVLAGSIGGAAGLPDAANPQAALARLDPLATVLLWLGSINIILALFNLIPGFPLDGGRVLRSILWAVTDDLRRATRWAAWVGQAVAWLLIVTGIAMAFGARVPFFGTGLTGGLWLAFIGWFLNSAAVQSYQQVVLQDMLEGVPVSRLMRPDPRAVPRTSTIATLVDEAIMSSDERAFPVVEGEQLAGLVCLEDVRKVPRTAWERTTVQEIMTPAEQLVATEPQEDVSDALQKLVRRDVSQMPVLEGRRLVGMLRRRDIARWLELQSPERVRDTGAISTTKPADREQLARTR